MTKYKLVTTDVLGYKLTQVKKRFLLFWWMPIIEFYPHETIDQFAEKCKGKGIDIYLLTHEEKTICP